MQKSNVYVLPILRLTKISRVPSKGSLPIDYHLKGMRVRYWRDDKSNLPSQNATLLKFPIVLNSDGSPWHAAVLWLLDRAQSNPTKINSLRPIAQDLGAYKTFLDDLGLDWNNFSSVEKLLRPTYLYMTHLHGLVQSGHIKPSTAQRRISTVIRFYRFAQSDKRLQFDPMNSPWAERTIGHRYQDIKGFSQVAKVVTTDLRIRASSGEDALSDEIYDGGRLRPMPTEEQNALICALRKLNNTEFSLMHYVALLTGAREMTIMTLRLRDFLIPPASILSWPHKIRCGPGTGIDTKLDKVDVYLNFPQALYQLLHVYAVSDRAKKRRVKSALTSNPLNYLFLTRQGNPYYEGKDDINKKHASTLKRSSSQGQSLREFIKKYVIPEVRKTIPRFYYKFHDTRATFGMNWVDHIMEAEGTSNQNYYWALDQLRKLMWHKSTDTTKGYLEYRSHRRHLATAIQGWASHLLEMVKYESTLDSHERNANVEQ